MAHLWAMDFICAGLFSTRALFCASPSGSWLFFFWQLSFQPADNGVYGPAAPAAARVPRFACSGKQRFNLALFFIRLILPLDEFNPFAVGGAGEPVSKDSQKFFVGNKSAASALPLQFLVLVARAV